VLGAGCWVLGGSGRTGVESPEADRAKSGLNHGFTRRRRIGSDNAEGVASLAGRIERGSMAGSCD